MDKLADGTPLNVAVYRAYRNAGLSHNQALAITAEVGRENGFRSSIIFGSHIDPAANGKGKAIRNLGMLSWNGNRARGLASSLKKQGVYGNGRMEPSQANLNAQARFSVGEMKGRYKDKLKHFWSNPNASPESFAREVGKNYIVWAYGQDSIRAKGGGRQPFDWKSHDHRRRGYLNKLSRTLGENTNYQAKAHTVIDETIRPIANSWEEFKKNNPIKEYVKPIQPIANSWKELVGTDNYSENLIRPIANSWEEFIERGEAGATPLQLPKFNAQSQPQPSPANLPPQLNIDETRTIRRLT